jgi:hypothetical protein
MDLESLASAAVTRYETATRIPADPIPAAHLNLR